VRCTTRVKQTWMLRGAVSCEKRPQHHVLHEVRSAKCKVRHAGARSTRSGHPF